MYPGNEPCDGMRVVEELVDILESLAPSMAALAAAELGLRRLELLDVRLPDHDAADLRPEAKRATKSKARILD